MAHDGSQSIEQDDTDARARTVQLELLRKMGGPRRLALARSLTSTILSAQRDEVLRANPGITERELRHRLLVRWYGHELADRVEAWLEARQR